MLSQAAYDPEVFRASAHELVNHLADYLAGMQALPVLPRTAPADLLARVDGEFPEAPRGDLLARLKQVLDNSIHVHHPRYVGHQVAVPLPGAVLAELVSALLNNGMAVYEMGQMHSVMERQLVRFLASELGYSQAADGILTGGGSVGNLTALLAARQVQAESNVWRDGQARPYAVMVSEQSHYCIQRAAQIMGWGEAGVYRIPTGADYAIRPESLAPTLQRARDDGRQVLAVVASVCSTATGAFDDLHAMADFCDAEKLWLHADGAHGASFVLSPKQRHLVAGIERADSVVWDLHKMMMLPATITALLFKNGRHSYRAFAQEASYLFNSEAPEEQWYNIGQRTLECTKRGMASVAHCILHHHGLALFREHLEHCVELARFMADQLRSSNDFELACEPACNILCFRYIGQSHLDLNATQSALREGILQSGRFYLVQATLRGNVFLRLTLINPATGERELRDLLIELRKLARQLSPS